MAKPLFTVCAVLACGLIARVAPGAISLQGNAWAWTQRRTAPVVVGVISGLILFAVAGTLDRVPIFFPDEWMYVQQARLFAQLRWTGGVRPPFFDHVAAVSAVASKYPPGQSLLLIPGILLDAPTLMPIVISAATSALLFAIARRISDARVATIFVLYWLSLAPTLLWHVSYMSELTSGLAWALAWWSLLDYAREGRQSALVGTALAVGLAAITRPFSAIALFVPIAFVVIAYAIRHRRWRAIAYASVAGALVLAVIPLWSTETTGDWRLTPTEAFRRDYIPFDKLGFGLDSTPPLRTLPAGVDSGYQTYRDGHRRYRPSTIPIALSERSLAVGRDVWPGARRPGLIPFAFIGLIVAGVDGWVAFASVVLLVVLYLLYWTPVWFTIYYAEAEPVLCFLTALGCVRAIEWVAGASGRRGTPLVTFVIALLGATLVVRSTLDARQDERTAVAYYSRFARLMQQLPPDPSLVIIHYGPGHPKLRTLARNELDLARARVWLVESDSADDQRIRDLAPERRAYAFDESTWTLTPLP